MSVDDRAIFELIGTFFGAAFRLHDATRLFGADGTTVALSSFQLQIQPADPALGEVVIETDDPVPPDEEPFAAGVVVKLARPLSLRFAPYVARFGPVDERPQLKPDDDRICQLLIRGLPYEGYLAFFVDPRREDDEVQLVHGITLRRFPEGTPP